MNSEKIELFSIKQYQSHTVDEILAKIEEELQEVKDELSKKKIEKLKLEEEVADLLQATFTLTKKLGLNTTRMSFRLLSKFKERGVE